MLSEDLVSNGCGSTGAHCVASLSCIQVCSVIASVVLHSRESHVGGSSSELTSWHSGSGGGSQRRE